MTRRLGVHSAPAMRASLCLLVLIAACSSPTPASGDGTRGTVTSVDLSPMAYDGDAVIVMETAAGESVAVHVPARMNLCAARGLDLVGDLRVGDEIDVTGETGPDGAIRPCAEAEHSIVRVSAADAQTWEGHYVGGFETSAFRACGETGDAWWLTPSDDFTAAYNALVEEHAGPRQGRQFGPHVRVQIEGDRSARGQHGHLGMAPYEIRVTRLIDMAFVASGDGEWPEPDC